MSEEETPVQAESEQPAAPPAEAKREEVAAEPAGAQASAAPEPVREAPRRPEGRPDYRPEPSRAGGPGRRPGGGPSGPGARPGARRPRRKVCSFCVEKGPPINYKDAAKLRRFISERGRILPRRTTGTCGMHQRVLAHAVKRAREIALLPFVAD